VAADFAAAPDVAGRDAPAVRFVQTAPMTDLSVDAISLSDPALWAEPEAEREAVFATLRAERPISWHAEPAFDQYPAGPGYWAVTRFDDVWRASRSPETFISGKGVNIGDMPVEISELFGSMIAMDAPRHSTLRVSPPRRSRRSCAAPRR